MIFRPARRDWPDKPGLQHRELETVLQLNIEAKAKGE